MKKNFKKQTFYLIALTVITKIVALGRELLLVTLFGTSWVLDSYITGIAIPFFFLTLFSGGAFIPTYVSWVVRLKNKSKKLNLFPVLVSIAILWLVALCFIGLTYMFGDMYIKAARPDIQTPTLRILHIAIWSLLFYLMSSVTQAILNALENFNFSGMQDMVMALSVITFAIIAYKTDNYIFLGYGFVFAALARFLIQLPALWVERDKLYVDRRNFSFQIVALFFKKLTPMILVYFIPQIFVLYTKQIAAGMEEGFQTALGLAMRLSEMGKSILAVSISTTMLPRLSKAFVRKDFKEVEKLLSYVIRIVSLASLMIAGILLRFSVPLIKVVFEYKNFNHHSTLMTAHLLSYLSLYIITSSIVYVILQGFYAKLEWKSILIVNIIVTFIGILSAHYFSLLMNGDGVALAIGLQATFSVILMLYMVYRHRLLDLKSLLKGLIKQVLAFIIALTLTFLHFPLLLSFLLYVFFFVLVLILLKEEIALEGFVYLLKLIDKLYGRRKTI